MRVYEEYETPREKRAAQRGAKRGVATGKARGYLLVFNEDGLDVRTGCYSGFGELYAGCEPGDDPRAVVSVDPHVDFLRTLCRSVGFGTIPKAWKVAFARRLDNCIVDENDPGARRRYRKILAYART